MRKLKQQTTSVVADVEEAADSASQALLELTAMEKECI